MKSTIIAALVAITCSPVLASAPTAPLSAAPVEASPATTANPVTTATPSAPVKINPEFFTETFPIQSANQHPSFCGQDMVYRLLAKTEFNQQLQQRLQEELRQAIAKAVAEGRIPAPQPDQPAVLNPQPEQPAAINPQPAQPAPQAPAKTGTTGPTSPQE